MATSIKFRREKTQLLLSSSDNPQVLAIDIGTTREGVVCTQLGDECVRVTVSNRDNNQEIVHKFSSGGHWYGGPQVYYARWPIETQDVFYQDFTSKDLMANPEKLGSILERYWLSSSGVAIWIPSDSTNLNYGVQDGCVVLGAQTSLEYLVCKSGGNLKDTHEYMIRNYLKKPAGIPDQRMMTHPVWSTWAKYKIFINQDVVLDFAREIRDHGFKDSQLEIDDTYTTNYGDHLFESSRFPNPAEMVNELKRLGFRVTSWVHPFANYNSKAFGEGVEKGYLILDEENSSPGMIKWWQGFGCMVDVMNPEAVDWYYKKLDDLKDLGIDSFKFDAGEACYMPKRMKYNCNLMTQKYVEVVGRYGGMLETRAAYRNQDSPTFVRMMDKDSHWGFDNGLKTMIPSALHLSIIGYHFQIPDMIGGNAMGPMEDWYSGAIPEKELYIRWFQLSAFLMTMQISICPWQYDEETTEIARQMVELHENYVAPKIIALSKQTVATGAPIIRPMWWFDPNDERLLTVEDQFMIGDEVLVAPVVDKIAERKIIFPQGQWKDITNEDIITGPVEISYPVTIRSIPYFENISKSG